MNRFMLVSAALLVGTSSFSARAQTSMEERTTPSAEQTLIPSRFTNGGYGAPVQRFSSVAGKNVLFSGVEGGWIMNHQFILGLAGYGMATQNVRNSGTSLRDSKGRAPVVEMGYGGLLLGYTPQSMSLGHLAFQVVIGGGGFTYDVEDIAGVRQEDAPCDAFFVAEPSLQGEVNITRFLRIGVGGGYRFISGASLDGLRDRDLRGASASLTFKLGHF